MNGSPGRLTTADIVGASSTTALATAIVAPYVLDRIGVAIAPWPMLVIALTAGAAMAAWLRRDRTAGDDLAPFAGVILGITGALLWMARPDLLPLGGGGDLTHHLQLVGYIEQNWRLPVDADIHAIGGMIDYTPGAHLLASLAGASSGRDGLHAMHPLLAVMAALKAGVLFLIARRALGGAEFRTPLALGAVLLLFLPTDYFLGWFIRFSFFAQVAAELFAVVMWWAMAVYDEAPSARAAAVFAVAGVAAFLTWPVWIGTPLFGFVVLAAVRARTCWRVRRARTRRTWR